MTKTTLKYGWLAFKIAFLLLFVYHVAYNVALTY